MVCEYCYVVDFIGCEFDFGEFGLSVEYDVGELFDVGGYVDLVVKDVVGCYGYFVLWFGVDDDDVVGVDEDEIDVFVYGIWLFVVG